MKSAAIGVEAFSYSTFSEISAGLFGAYLRQELYFTVRLRLHENSMCESLASPSCLTKDGGCASPRETGGSGPVQSFPRRTRMIRITNTKPKPPLG